MEIKVTGRKMPVTDSLKDYAEEKIGNSMKVMDIDPLSADVVLHMEKNPSIALPAICEVTMTAKGHLIRVEEREEDMYAAIDVAAAKVLRQLRKFKTRVVEHNTRTDASSIRTKATETPDFDALMDELADDAVVRVKDVDFEPLTLHRPRQQRLLHPLPPQERRLRPAQAEARLKAQATPGPFASDRVYHSKRPTHPGRPFCVIRQTRTMVGID